MFTDTTVLSPIKESTNNEVFAYGQHIIKISSNPNNLQIEYETLKQLEGKGAFPRAEQYGPLDNQHFFLILSRLP
jgi:hypothetical protein